MTVTCADHQHRSLAVCDNWLCKCGNTAILDGFAPCDLVGREVEPTADEWPLPLFVCGRCGVIINTQLTPLDTLEIVKAIQDAQKLLGVARSATCDASGSPFNNPPYDKLSRALRYLAVEIEGIMAEGEEGGAL